MSETAIEAIDLAKRFRSGTVAVNELNLAIERGAVYGLMGRNGAGKTTTLRLLMGLLRADTGVARVLGADLWNASRSLRGRVAYVSQSQQLPGWMTLAELSRYAAHFYETWNQVQARDLARSWCLPWDQPVGRMSGGEQRKAAILLALAPRPEVLMLDEPSAGLDPIARREMLDSLVSVMSRGDGCTILLSTQIISDLERIVDRVGIMDRGKIVTDMGLEQLQQTTRRVQVIFPGAAAPADFSIPGSLQCYTAGPVVTAVVRLKHENDLEPVRRLAGVRVQVFPLGLEEIFIELFGRTERDSTPKEKAHV